MKTSNIHVEPANQLGILEISGPTTVADFSEAAIALGRHTQWDPAFNILIEFDDSTGLESLTLAELRELQAFMSDWNTTNRTGSRPRTAIVSPDALKRVIADLWALMHDEPGWPVQILTFADQATARAWLQEQPDPDAAEPAVTKPRPAS